MGQLADTAGKNFVAGPGVASPRYKANTGTDKATIPSPNFSLCSMGYSRRFLRLAFGAGAGARITAVTLTAARADALRY
ncbi:MAG: hypothetical protein R3F24_14775 [Gammaproteobacteria bacterium]